MEVSSHSLFLLQQLNVQREFGFLCDCTVAIGNVYFKAHRAVLAAFSNYFKMIFIHQSRWVRWSGAASMKLIWPPTCTRAQHLGLESRPRKKVSPDP